MAPLGKHALTFSIITTSSSRERGNIPGPPAPTTTTTTRTSNTLPHPRFLQEPGFPQHQASCGKLCLLPTSGTNGAWHVWRAVCFLISCHGEITQHGPGPSSPTPASLGSLSSGWGLGVQTAMLGVKALVWGERPGTLLPNPHLQEEVPSPTVKIRRVGGPCHSLIQSGKNLRGDHLCKSLCIKGEARASKPGLLNVP